MQTGPLRQFKEKFHRLAGGAVLRIVEVNAGPFGHHALAAVRVCSEQRLKMAVPDILGVDLEISPRGTLTERTLAAGNRTETPYNERSRVRYNF